MMTCVTRRVSPFRDLRVKGCLPPHRSLSQVATSFIVSRCLGIRTFALTETTTKGTSLGSLDLSRAATFPVFMSSILYFVLRDSEFLHSQMWGLTPTIKMHVLFCYAIQLSKFRRNLQIFSGDLRSGDL